MLHKNTFYSFGIWIIIFLIAIGLIFANFSSNSKSEKNTDIIFKIDNYFISNTEINSIIKNIWKQKHNSLINENIQKKKLIDIICTNVAFNINTKKYDFIITNKELLYTILETPYLQINNKFSPKLYKTLLTKTNSSEFIFQKNLKKTLLHKQIKQGLILSYPKFNNNFKLSLIEQKIKFKYLNYKIENFKNKNNIKQKYINNFYKKHSKYLYTSNSIKIEYVDLSIKNITNNLILTNKDTQTHYKKHKTHYTHPYIIKIKHIFISKKNKNKNFYKKLKNHLTKKLNQKIYNFSDLTKKYDESKNFLQKNNKIGWITKGELNNKIEKEAFSLKKIGELSKIIKTKNGIYILKLTDKKKENLYTIKHINLDLINKHKKIYSKKYISRIYKNIKKSLSKEEYSLKNISTLTNINIKKSDFFSKNGNINTSISPKLIKIALNTNKINNNPIKLYKNKYIIFRTIHHKPHKKLMFNKIKFLIKKYLQRIKTEKSIINNYTSLKKNNINYNKKWTHVNAYKINSNILNIPKNLTQEIFSLQNKKTNNTKLLKLKNNYYVINLKNINSKKKIKPKNNIFSTTEYFLCKNNLINSINLNINYNQKTKS